MKPAFKVILMAVAYLVTFILGSCTGLIGLTVIAEAVRYFCKYDTRKGVRWSFIPFAFSFFAYTARWWSSSS